MRRQSSGQLSWAYLIQAVQEMYGFSFWSRSPASFNVLQDNACAQLKRKEEENISKQTSAAAGGE
jgi:hypothetical protein